MTLRRVVGSVESVLLSVLERLPPATIKERTGKSANAFYKLSHPQNNSRLGFEDAALLDAALEDENHAPVFAFLFAEIKARARGNGAKPAYDLNRGVVAAVSEVGDVASAVRDALADDDHVDEREEAPRIAKECREAIEALQAVLHKVEPNHSKQSHLEPVA